MSFSEFKKRYNIKLNEEQEKAVKQINGCVLLLAVPGSGKTTTLITRLGYMTMWNNINPSSILAITFTKNATREMSDRFAKKFDKKIAEKIKFHTIHSCCLKIVTEYKSTRNMVLEDKRRKNILNKIYRKVNDYEPTDTELSAVQNEVSLFKSCIDATDIANINWQTINLDQIIIEYNSYLKKHYFIDYDDILQQAYEILTTNKKALEYYQNKYKYICVDEAQDTSKIQHKIIKLLSEKYNNVFMVGDEDQSIYGFRGAVPSYLLNFEKVYNSKPPLTLSINFRSSRLIVNKARQFIEKNTDRRPKNMKGYRFDIGSVVIKTAVDSYSQYETAIQMIGNLKDSDSTTAVLYRNNISGVPFIYKFTKIGIPYIISDSVKRVFESTPFSLFIDLIDYSINLNDRSLFADVMKDLNVLLSSTDIVKNTIENYKEEFLLDAFLEEAIHYTGYKSSSHAYNTIQLVKELITLFTEIHANAPLDCIDIINNFSKNRNSTKKYYINDYIRQGLEYICTEDNDKLKLAYYMDIIKNSLRENDPGDSEENNVDLRNGVFLSTIHSAKGMEFDNVFIVDCVDGTLPSFEESSDYEEERRLFYVAITRAKDNLFLMKRTDVNTSFIDEIMNK